MRDRDCSKHFMSIDSIGTHNNFMIKVLLLPPSYDRETKVEREAIYSRPIALNGGDQTQTRVVALRNPRSPSCHTVSREGMKKTSSFILIVSQEVLQPLGTLVRSPKRGVIHFSASLSSESMCILSSFQNFVQNMKYSFLI